MSPWLPERGDRSHPDHLALLSPLRHEHYFGVLFHPPGENEHFPRAPWGAGFRVWVASAAEQSCKQVPSPDEWHYAENCGVVRSLLGARWAEGGKVGGPRGPGVSGGAVRALCRGSEAGGVSWEERGEDPGTSCWGGEASLGLQRLLSRERT